MTPRTFELMQEAAQVLTGKRVVIRFERPDLQRADGMTWRDNSGNIRIDLAPKLKDNPARLFDVFLHELAHAKLHGAGYKKQSQPKPASIAHGVEDATVRAVMAEQETQANKQAGEWMNYARATWQNCIEATPLDSHIRTLTYYKIGG